MEIPDKLIEKLSRAKHVTVLTGAGVSAESGIQTFRDPDGLWSKLNPAELASMDGFLSNPELVWSWYQHRRKIVHESAPNPGHYAIAEMEEIFPVFTLITQNVDRLHQKAGSTNVLELHGNIIDNHCSRCGKHYNGETEPEDNQLPRCGYCGALVRPSVVWFGEMLPGEILDAAEKAALNCDVFFSVGTSAEVYPAANLPISAKYEGAALVEVNPNNTVLTRYTDFILRAPSGEALPVLLDKLKKFMSL